jgi:hypothetical protein
MLSCSKLEHDDMASEQSSEKAGNTGREQPRDQRPPSPRQPHIQPPFLNDGPELVRDSHC